MTAQLAGQTSPQSKSKRLLENKIVGGEVGGGIADKISFRGSCARFAYRNKNYHCVTIEHGKLKLMEILIGIVIGLAILTGAIFFSFRKPNIKWPLRHDIRGNGDYAQDGHVRNKRSFDSGIDSSGDGGCGDDEREGGDVGQGGDDDQANQGNEGEEQ